MAKAHGNAHRDNDILRSKQQNHRQRCKLSPYMRYIRLFVIAFIMGGFFSSTIDLTQREMSPFSGDIERGETLVSKLSYSSKVARAGIQERSPQIALRESHVP